MYIHIYISFIHLYLCLYPRTVGDELGDHGVVEHGDLRALVHARVDAHRGEPALAVVGVVDRCLVSVGVEQAGYARAHTCAFAQSC